jgi:hypothetical protein
LLFKVYRRQEFSSGFNAQNQLNEYHYKI